MNSLLHFVWDQKLGYGPSSKYMMAEDKQLTGQIMWYVQYKAELVAELNMNHLHEMGRKTKKRLLALMDTIRKGFQIERNQQLNHQRTIL